jgi:hypothetical protein
MLSSIFDAVVSLYTTGIQNKVTRSGKKVSFSNKTYIAYTYSHKEYDRSYTRDILSQEQFVEIFREMNDFKKHMRVHPRSINNTRFHKLS